MTNDLIGNEFEGLSALKIMNCDKKKKKEGNGVQEPLYKKLKTRGILSRPNIEEKSRPLDLNPTVGCQECNATQST